MVRESGLLSEQEIEALLHGHHAGLDDHRLRESLAIAELALAGQVSRADDSVVPRPEWFEIVSLVHYYSLLADLMAVDGVGVPALTDDPGVTS